jgi:hypothetical protein
MKCNVGKTDRILRFVIGIIICAAGFYFKCWLGVIGIVPILTAVFRFCPLYVPFKISTDKKQK